MHLIKTTVASNNGGSSSWMKPDSLSTSRFGDDGGDEGSSHLEHIASQLIMSEDEDDSAPVMSAYMTRQAERAGITGLSPMEEMRLAHGELAAKVAKKRDLDDLPAASFRLNHYLRVPPVKKVLKRMHSSMTGISSSKKKRRDGFRNAPSVVCEAEVKRITQELANNMDDMTAEQAINFVQSVQQREDIIKMRVDDYDAKRVPWFLISPASKFRVRWDILSVVLITYNGFYIPFSIAFGRRTDVPALEVMDQFQIMFNVLYFMDVVVNFFSAFEARGRVEIRWTAIIKRYLLTWFIVDMLAATPVEAIYMALHRHDLTSSNLNKYFKYLRIVKLSRMLGFTHILNRVEYALLIKSTRSGLMKFCLLVCLTSHWFSCFFFFISNDVPGGWVDRHHLQAMPIYDQYVNAFYWSIMTMTTVGYGDVTGQNTHERGFSIFAMVVGAWIFAYGITNVVATVANLNHNDTEFQHKMDGINNFMERRDLPMELRTEIREFFMNSRLSTENTLKNESKILSELSALLRSKIALAINDSVLNKMPFFEGADHNFLMELALSMKMVCFPPHEEVIVEGEIGQEMFFIFRGAVEVMKDGDQIAVLGEQQYFGEMAIMNTNCMRLASVRTLCFCELRMLTRQKFLVALSHFPSMRKRIARIIHRRKVTHDQEMVHRKSSDFTGPTAPPSIKQKSTPRGGIHRRGSASPTAMEDLAASMVQGSHNLLEKVVGPDIFALEADAIVGSTMQRISQMNIVPNRNNDGAMAEGPPSDELRMIIHTLLEQQEMLLTEVAKLEDKVRALLPPSDPVKAGPHESYLTP
ncbi:hypothetical protein H257_00503 [Aphanomyces astaci]|uniref:Cyclic nucleotide-binding domain-containing protein n=1 Tax=Aphanomyces astaci TaxID=112090 RepID=W4HAU4_APHAT|nr:hypothetical protein H257_00503 [Aphanomyces astaci]ETV89130.1 hypothetical protein H257_00503 [Aphanomyces astaci]|eukprot:XP_009821530.1 hypothetical protein H257_00503 [Aphanomyces astaci]